MAHEENISSTNLHWHDKPLILIRISPGIRTERRSTLNFAHVGGVNKSNSPKPDLLREFGRIAIGWSGSFQKN
ncbi:hypothetical protein N7488_008247 [Penicillium malachiteum]|nr:hypothetical protein N7488_008247 [Penicillium malachiteum]